MTVLVCQWIQLGSGDKQCQCLYFLIFSLLRMLKKQVEDFNDIDLGPEEYELSLSEASLESSNRKELTQLAVKLQAVTNELKKMKADG